MDFSRRAFLTLPALAVTPSASAAAKTPNVVLIITDDQGYGDLSCHGNPVLKTPNLDALHKQSVRFTNFHVSPTCAPTRSALMTGRYTNATGAWHTIMGRSLLAHDEFTLPQAFRNAGYRTGIFGKWHLGDNYPCRPIDRGFDEAVVCGGGGVWQTPDFFPNDYIDDTYFHNGVPQKYTGYCTDVFFSEAQRFIGESARPFFCYIATNAPHGPMWAQEKDEAPYRNIGNMKEPGFFGMIANIDENVGKLRAFLATRGLAENTIFLFMTDNGTSSGAQIFNAGMRASKGSPYDGGHRVPFFVHWPAGQLGTPRDIGTLAGHIDVFPTLMEWCGLTRSSPLPLHGRSLTPLFGNGGNWPDRAITTDSQRLENLVKWKHAAVMTQRWRLVSPTGNGDAARLELYDIQRDPGQKENIAAANPDVVTRLKGEYEKWWTLTSGRANEYVRIVLGSDKEKVSRLTCHDWHGEGAERVWNQRAIRMAAPGNGFWAVQVARAGRYRIALRRWPREVDVPINGVFTDPVPNRETAKSKAIAATQARFRLGKAEGTKPVAASDREVVFETRLEAGPAELQTWFQEAGGSERGAYFVYIERV